MLLWQGNSTYDTEADKRRLRNIRHDNKQDMDSLYWANKKKSETETSAACGTACGASDKPEENQQHAEQHVEHLTSKIS